MHELFREMLHYRNELGEKEPAPLTVADFESRYDKILDKAQEEYEYEPPSEYYREGYNLFVRLREYKESELLFLHGKRFPLIRSFSFLWPCKDGKLYQRRQNRIFSECQPNEASCACLQLIQSVQTTSTSCKYAKATG